MDGESHDIPVLTPPPAEVDAGDLGRRRVAQLQQRAASAAHLCAGDLGGVVLLGELIGGQQLVAQPLAFLVVGGDPIGAAGVHLLDLIKLRDANGLAFRVNFEGCAAMAAELQVGCFSQVGMAAGAADQGILGGESGHASCRGVLLQAENRTLHLVGVALVIDQRVGPEF